METETCTVDTTRPIHFPPFEERYKRELAAALSPSQRLFALRGREPVPPWDIGFDHNADGLVAEIFETLILVDRDRGVMVIGEVHGEPRDAVRGLKHTLRGIERAQHWWGRRTGGWIHPDAFARLAWYPERYIEDGQRPPGVEPAMFADLRMGSEEAPVAAVIASAFDLHERWRPSNPDVDLDAIVAALEQDHLSWEFTSHPAESSNDCYTCWGLAMQFEDHPFPNYLRVETYEFDPDEFDVEPDKPAPGDTELH